MKLEDITDQIIRAVEGGTRTDDSKFAPKAIEALLPKWKQMAHLIVYNGSKTSKSNRFIGPENYMQTTLTFDATIQVTGAEYLLFAGEPPIQIDNYSNGCRFVGDKLTGQNFTQLLNPSDYGVYKDAGLISINEVYYWIGGGYYTTYGNLQLRSIDLDFIPADPMNVSTFNPVTMEYPISKDVFDVVMKLAVAELMPEALKPADLLNNAAPNQ